MNAAEKSFKERISNAQIHQTSDFQVCGPSGTQFLINGTLSPKVHISYNSRNTTDVNNDEILQDLIEKLGLNENAYIFV